MLPAQENPRQDRVLYELRKTGVTPEQAAFRPLRTGTHTRGYLPHIKREGAAYFVTFRLDDSLPRDVLIRLQFKRARALTAYYSQKEGADKTGAAPPNPEKLEQVERTYFREFEAFLDKGSGECWLRKPEIAQIVFNSLEFFKGQRYELPAWVIMPNHVHLLIWPLSGHTLSDLLRSLKTFTSREANNLLRRTGIFWQRESYDHWIRNDVERARCIGYIENNPVKAGLCQSHEQWRWSSAFRR